MSLSKCSECLGDGKILIVAWFFGTIDKIRDRQDLLSDRCCLVGIAFVQFCWCRETIDYITQSCLHISFIDRLTIGAIDSSDSEFASIVFDLFESIGGRKSVLFGFDDREVESVVFEEIIDKTLFSSFVTRQLTSISK